MEKLGLSGDSIIIENKQIRKICQTDQSRFILNIKKQQSFNNPHINSVPIIEKGITSDNKNYVIMPLLQCENSIIWLSKADIKQASKLIEILKNYLNSILEKSEIRKFESELWINKLQTLQDKIKDADLNKIILHLMEMKFNNDLYYGDYHGDFTFSNLFIFNEENKREEVTIDAIDFLDSFIYSPINDFVKIRQDSKHLWTLKLMKQISAPDTNKVIILLKYIDKEIENIINSNDILKEYYLPFQIINLMRIIPYNKSKKVFAYLKKEIQELYNEFNTSHALCGQVYQIQ